MFLLILLFHDAKEQQCIRSITTFQTAGSEWRFYGETGCSNGNGWNIGIYVLKQYGVCDNSIPVISENHRNIHRQFTRQTAKPHKIATPHPFALPCEMQTLTLHTTIGQVYAL